MPVDGAGLALDVSTLAAAAVSAGNFHATTPHYTNSRHNSGAIRFRTIIPPNNTVRYLYGGTSTEAGINGVLGPIITSSGHLVATHKRPSSDGQVWNDTVFNNSKAAFDAAPNQYAFTYWRDTFAQGQNVINYNQSNLLPLVYDCHFDDVNGGMGSTNQLLDDIHSRCQFLQSNYAIYGWMGIPLHLGVARLKEVDSSIIYSDDGTHMTEEHYYMMGSMIFTSTLGKDPTPPASIASNTKSMNGFNVGRQTIKELAFLSETMAFTPESSLAITPPAPLVKARWETFSQSFTATGGTPPYTWSESSASGLPAGLTLSPAGVLSGAVTTSPKIWQLVIKATDSLGAIHKVPFSLNVTTGAGSLAISQTTPYSVVIAPGGSAPIATATYTVLNPGLTSINWSASKTQPWLVLSLTTGSLTAGASVNVTVSMNAGVSALAVGIYLDSIFFTNTTSGFGNTTRGVNLRVSATPTVSVGADRTVTFNPVPWTPAVLSPVGWYDATDAATITQSGPSVSAWRSKVGSSHMLQSNTANQPQTGTAQINGLNAIAFDGAGDGLKTSSNPFGTQIRDAMWMGVTNIGTFTNSVMFSLSGSGSNQLAKRWQAEVPWGTGSLAFDNGSNTGAPRVGGASGWASGQSKLLGFYGSVTANVQQVWESGALRFGDSTGHTIQTDSGMALGFDGYGTTDNCTMGEVIIINGVVSIKNRQRLEGHLAKKWGFALTLPASHPYRTAPLVTGTLVNLVGITANDSDGDPLTYTWTVVSAPAGFTIENASSPIPSVFLEVVGTYTLRLTVSDGYSQASDDITIQAVNLTPYQTWSSGSFANPFILTGVMEDPDGDGDENLLEFAFGTDPTRSSAALLNFVPGGEVISSGMPLVAIVGSNPATCFATYARRKNHATTGMTYRTLFSADLKIWTAREEGLSVITSSGAGDMEVIRVPFPASVPLENGGMASPGFFRVSVTVN